LLQQSRSPAIHFGFGFEVLNHQPFQLVDGFSYARQLVVQPDDFCNETGTKIEGGPYANLLGITRGRAHDDLALEIVEQRWRIRKAFVHLSIPIEPGQQVGKDHGLSGANVAIVPHQLSFERMTELPRRRMARH
jgi:hypothetical protein